MKTRIDRCFENLRQRGEKGFVAYITAGDPDLDATVDTVLSLEEAGADVVELGIPFSDPLADGLANQRTAERALNAGTTYQGILETVAKIRARSEIPLLFFSYVNPLFVRGFDVSMGLAAQAGIDGVLLVDLSLEEAGPFDESLAAHQLNHVVLVTPTTPEERIARLTATGSGFVYAVSRSGVTGEQGEMQMEANEVLARCARHTKLPVALGFGISTPQQAAAYAAMTDAVVVGSYIVNTYHQCGNSSAGRRQAASKVRELVCATKGITV